MFLTEYKKWWPGEVVQVFPTRTVSENFKILFDDETEPALTRLDDTNYGRSANWVLIVKTYKYVYSSVEILMIITSLYIHTHKHTIT